MKLFVILALLAIACASPSFRSFVKTDKGFYTLPNGSVPVGHGGFEEEAFHIDVEKIKHAVQVVGKVAGAVSQIAGIIGNAEEENLGLVKNAKGYYTLPEGPVTVGHGGFEEEAFHIDVEKIKHAVQVVGKVAGVVSQIAGILSNAEEENLGLVKTDKGYYTLPNGPVTVGHGGFEEEAFHIDVEKIKHAVQVVGKVAGVVSQIAGVIGNAEEENLGLVKNAKGYYTLPEGPVTVSHGGFEEENIKIEKIIKKIGSGARIATKIINAISEEENLGLVKNAKGYYTLPEGPITVGHGGF